MLFKRISLQSKYTFRTWCCTLKEELCKCNDGVVYKIPDGLAMKPGEQLDTFYRQKQGQKYKYNWLESCSIEYYEDIPVACKLNFPVFEIDKQYPTIEDLVTEMNYSIEDEYYIFEKCQE